MQNQEAPATTLDRNVANQLIGTVIADRYKVGALIGIGSMGAVYLVHHVAIRKRTAVKVLHPSMLGVPEMVARFEREAMTAAHIDHPNVAAAHDYGRTADGGYYLVLDYIDGQELRALLKKGPLPVARALHIARQITSALCLTHDLNIVHRDLKPENIMLTRRDGQPDFVKILDFGLAKVPVELQLQGGASGVVSPQFLTKVGSLYGTPGYMAPEQALSEAVDSRCDLYSLGSILYEMLSGRPPFDGNTVLELLDNHLQTPLPPIRKRAPGVSVPEPVEAVVRRLLAKRPEDRYKNPQELLAALDELAPPDPAGQPVPPPPTPAAAPAARPPAEPLGPESVPPIPPLAARRGTVVALPLPTASLWSRLGQAQKKLPWPLGKLPLSLLIGALLVALPLLLHLLWLRR